MHPTELFDRLYSMASTRKRKTLELIHKACIHQSKTNEKDFSLGKIASIISVDGGPGEQSLRNKNGEDYRILISAWAEYCNTTLKKPRTPQNTTVNEEILSSIKEPTLKALVGMILAENRKLKRELSLLKANTTLTIDMRSMHRNFNNDTDNTVIVETIPTYKLTETEINALQNAISENFLNKMGWHKDDYGRIKQRDYMIYKPGYVNAINKVLSAQSNK